MNFNNFKPVLRLTLTFLLLSFGAFVARAQDTDNEGSPPQEDTRAQERIKNLRIAYITDKLGLTPEQAEKFWPVYREFVQERAKLRLELKTAQRSLDPNQPDPKKQQELIDLGLRVKQRELDLEKEYSGRLLQVINAQQMLNLHKAEQEFRSMIINQLQQRRLMQERKENFRDKNQLLQQRQK